MKDCTKCKVKKELSCFGKNKNRPDGLKVWCKNCVNSGMRKYKKTKLGLLQNIYGTQVLSSKQRGHNPPSYTSKQFKEMYINNNDFVRLYKEWVSSDYNTNLVPSFDRLNDSLGYSFENLNKWMTWQDNRSKGHLTKHKLKK